MARRGTNWRASAVVLILAGACVAPGGEGGRCDPGFVRGESGLCTEATGRLDVVWDPDPDCGPASTAVVVSIDEQSGDEYLDLYDCPDFGGLTGPLPLGAYQVHVELTDDLEAVLYARSNAVAVEVLALDQVVDVDFPFLADRGVFGVSWTVAGGCDGAGAAWIELLADQVVIGRAGCEASELESEPVAVGPHALILRSLDPGEQVVAATDGFDAEIRWGNERVVLGTQSL